MELVGGSQPAFSSAPTTWLYDHVSVSSERCQTCTCLVQFIQRASDVSCGDFSDSSLSHNAPQLTSNGSGEGGRYRPRMNVSV